jgi:hypothetical protein
MVVLCRVEFARHRLPRFPPISIAETGSRCPSDSLQRCLSAGVKKYANKP